MAIMKNTPEGEFSVYWWDPEDRQYEEARFTDAETAVGAAVRLTRGPAAVMGIIKRVIITDGGDCCCFEWKDGKNVFDGVKS
jgi:hypothetical protein